VILLYSVIWVQRLLLLIVVCRAVKKKVRGRSSLQNQPIVVEGLLGVMSAAELLWIAVFMAIFTWMVVNYMIRDFHAAETEPREDYETVWGRKVKLEGVRLGFIGIICLNLLFLPVSRGSVLFRSIDIPFEHATKYHVWLGHFVMILFTLHGLFFIIPWYFEGHLIARVCCITIHFLHGPLHGGFDC
jgi:ferric-chelate reductase